MWPVDRINHMRYWSLLWVLMLAGGALAEAPKAPAAAPTKPYVLHLPGVSGTSHIDYTLREGLKKSGFDGPFEIYDWTCNDPGLAALRARERNEKQAQIVADMIAKQFRAHPGQPIWVTCHSGGAGPATWALEKLPADVKVQGFLMLAPALSPTYDLTKALSHVTDRAYYFFSAADDLVLGTGTKMFGTIDGQKVESAGKVGFERPKDGDEKQYAKLLGKAYMKEWARFGNVGGHVGCMHGSFVQAIVGPVMLGKELSTAELEKLAAPILPDIFWPK